VAESCLEKAIIISTVSFRQETVPKCSSSEVVDCQIRKTS